MKTPFTVKLAKKYGFKRIKDGRVSYILRIGLTEAINFIPKGNCYIISYQHGTDIIESTLEDIKAAYFRLTNKRLQLILNSN